MNKELLELYFQLEKKISDNTKKKKEIEQVIEELYAKLRTAFSSNILLKSELDMFVKRNIHPLRKKITNKTLGENAKKIMQETILIIEKIMGQDVNRAKEIRDTLNIQNIITGSGLET